MSKKTFEVIASKDTTKGNVQLKLRWTGITKTVETAFGISETQEQTTYYMFVAKEGAAPVGTKAELDLTQFDVVERPYSPEDEPEKEMMLKYLYIKRA